MVIEITSHYTGLESIITLSHIIMFSKLHNHRVLEMIQVRYKILHCKWFRKYALLKIFRKPIIRMFAKKLHNWCSRERTEYMRDLSQTLHYEISKIFKLSVFEKGQNMVKVSQTSKSRFLEKCQRVFTK